MNEQEKAELVGEGVAIRHSFDSELSSEQWAKLNRLIEIELLLEQENKSVK